MASHKTTTFLPVSVISITPTESTPSTRERTERKASGRAWESLGTEEKASRDAFSTHQPLGSITSVSAVTACLDRHRVTCHSRPAAMTRAPPSQTPAMQMIRNPNANRPTRKRIRIVVNLSWLASVRRDLRSSCFINDPCAIRRDETAQIGDPNFAMRTKIEAVVCEFIIIGFLLWNRNEPTPEVDFERNEPLIGRVHDLDRLFDPIIQDGAMTRL